MTEEIEMVDMPTNWEGKRRFEERQQQEKNEN